MNIFIACSIATNLCYTTETSGLYMVKKEDGMVKQIEKMEDIKQDKDLFIFHCLYKGDEIVIKSVKIC